MKSTFLLIAPLLCTAYAGASPVQESRGQDARAPQGAAAGARAALAAPRQVSLKVTGLSQESAPTIERALRALEGRVEPPLRGAGEGRPAEAAAPVAGDQQVKAKVLADVRLDVEKGELTLAVAPGLTLERSAVERSLALGQARIDAEKSALAGRAIVVVSGVAGEDGLKPVADALSAAPFLRNVESRWNKEGARAEFHVLAGEGATFAALSKALAAAGEPYKLADVLWHAPKEPLRDGAQPGKREGGGQGR